MFNMCCCFSVTPADHSLEYAGVIKAGVLCQGNPIASFIPFITCSGRTTYYVKSTPNTSCPVHLCLTLCEYAQQPHIYGTSNTTLLLLPGDHVLTVIFYSGGYHWLYNLCKGILAYRESCSNGCVPRYGWLYVQKHFTCCTRGFDIYLLWKGWGYV